MRKKADKRKVFIDKYLKTNKTRFISIMFSSGESFPKHSTWLRCILMRSVFPAIKKPAKRFLKGGISSMAYRPWSTSATIYMQWNYPHM